jgi:hypothetical protein
LSANVELKPVKFCGHLLPGRDGKPAHVATLIRLIERGTQLRGGRRERFKAMRASSGWLTSEAWVTEYLEAVTADRMAAIDARLAGKTQKAITELA